ncbi:fructosamine kinase family protein [Ruegeria lacuscaerulensis]|uniref:fructosamine kinase family protein n=1 Tax=Ruegeria lacuscaerulensis TaxID=55218 RepID=UPI001480A0C1|nr:fructosamine kinase family protein [Ruegeria lacuscaerulensis]
MRSLIEKASALTSTTISGTEPLRGGSLSSVIRLLTSDGRSFVAKSGPMVKTEAQMLNAIRSAGAPAPQVVAVASGILILEDLGPDDGPENAWGSLGHELKHLHATKGPYFGWAEDHSFGKVNIPNEPVRSWPGFWAERRLLPSCSEIPFDLARKVEVLANRIDDLLPEHPPAALLHGDLWVGNVMARDGRITGLIDPSAYYGDAEVDLAMLSLFGSPDQKFWQAYGDIRPGFAERRPIYQLWPALVHLRLFGAGYRSLVEQCVSQAC